MDGRPHRHVGRLRQLLHERQRRRPVVLQLQRHRLPALRAARRPVGEPARARRLHVGAVLQHGPRRGAGHLHLHVRRVRRGQPDRQHRADPGVRAEQLRPAIARPGRHGLLRGLLPAADRRRREDAQGPDRADERPPDPARRQRRRRTAAGHEPRAEQGHERERLHLGLPVLQRRRRQHQHLLGVDRQRVPAVAAGRPRDDVLDRAASRSPCRRRAPGPPEPRRSRSSAARTTRRSLRSSRPPATRSTRPPATASPSRCRRPRRGTCGSPSPRTRPGPPDRSPSSRSTPRTRARPRSRRPRRATCRARR